MGKKRVKKSHSVGAADPSMDGGIPLLNEEALSALTAKIEKGLRTSNAQQETHTTAHKKRDHEENSRSLIGSKSKSSSKYLEPQRGTKRDAKGNTKVASQELGKHRIPTKQNKQLGDEETALLEEIIALGGTEEDLQLVADVASDEEANPDTGLAADKSFQKELASFVSGLGIETNASVDEDDAANVAEDEWEASSTSQASEQSMDMVEVEAVKRQQDQDTATVPDKSNRLVSTAPRRSIAQS